MSDLNPPITWSIDPHPRPSLVPGDSMDFRWDGGETTHVVTEADAAAGGFQVPGLPSGVPIEVRTRQRMDWEWSPASDFGSDSEPEVAPPYPLCARCGTPVDLWAVQDQGACDCPNCGLLVYEDGHTRELSEEP